MRSTAENGYLGMCLANYAENCSHYTVHPPSLHFMYSYFWRQFDILSNVPNLKGNSDGLAKY